MSAIGTAIPIPHKGGGWIDPEGNYGIHTRQYLGHTFRYRLACGWLRPTDTVLDAACGVGYGSQILSRVVQKVIALDVDEVALARARGRYNAPNIEYIQCDLDGVITLPECDVVVSFETIEHLLGDPVGFVGMLQTCAKRLIFLSTPVVPTTQKNHYHHHDFNETQVHALFDSKKWPLWEAVLQKPYLVSVRYRYDAYSR